jgi:hypothetical protein
VKLLFNNLFLKKARAANLLFAALLLFYSLFFCMQFSYMASPPQILAQDSSSINQTIALKPGFNFVSFTVTPPASHSRYG